MKIIHLLSLALALMIVPASMGAEPKKSAAKAAKTYAHKKAKAKAPKKGIVKKAGEETVAGPTAAGKMALIKPKKETLITYTLEKNQVGKPFAITLWERDGAKWNLNKRPEGIKFIDIVKGKETKTRGTSHKWIIAGMKKGTYELKFTKTYPLISKIKAAKQAPKTKERTYKIVVP